MRTLLTLTMFAGAGLLGSSMLSSLAAAQPPALSDGSARDGSARDGSARDGSARDGTLRVGGVSESMQGDAACSDASVAQHAGPAAPWRISGLNADGAHRLDADSEGSEEPISWCISADDPRCAPADDGAETSTQRGVRASCPAYRNAPLWLDRGRSAWTPAPAQAEVGADHRHRLERPPRG